MAPIDDIQALAERYAAASLAALERGRVHGYDATSEAAEQADLALVCRRAVADMRAMSPAEQQDTAHRLKAALWAREDDSPEVGADESEAHP